MEKFIVLDCTLLTKTSGLPPAINLREFRERLAICNQNVLYHHFCEPPLRPSLDNPSYQNDFAEWAMFRLADRVLAERLGIINPYMFADLEKLRDLVIDLVDERLSEVPYIPFAAPGTEFYFREAVTVVFDTGKRIENPAELPGAIGKMTNSSVYYHFLEARRRPPLGIDDFSSWLSGFEGWDHWLPVLKAVDFAFYTMTELRHELVRILGQGE